MNWSDLTMIGPMIWLALGGVAVLLVDAFVRRKGQGHLTFVSVLFLALAAMSALKNLGPDAATGTAFQGALMADGFSAYFNLIFVIVAFMSIAVGSVYFGREDKPIPEFYPLVLFATVGMMVMAAAVDLVTLFVGLETMSIALYVLSSIRRRSIWGNEAGFKYLILGAFSSAFLLYGMSLLYGSTQSLNLTQIASLTTRDPSLATAPLFLAGWAFLIIGLGFKVAMVPFHMWTPDVYDGAPAPITGFMAAGVKAASFAALLRVAWAGVPVFLDTFEPLLVGLAIVTMVFGNVVALAQTNLKRMLAYSAIAHAGYLLVGVVASNPVVNDPAAKGVLFYLFSYGLMNVGAFAVVSLVSNKNQENAEFAGLAGLARRHPLAAATVAIFMLSLAGIPPTAGFWGKLYIFRAAIHEGMIGLSVIALLNSAVAMFYYLRVIVVMYMRESQAEEYNGSSLQIDAAMAAAAVLLLWVGLFPGPVTELARQGAAALAGSF